MEQQKLKPFYLTTNSKTDKYPYIFRNKLIDDYLYIAQKAENIENALYILDTWNKLKYNPGEIKRYESPSIPHTIYLYNSNRDIKRDKVLGGNDDYKILLYKKNGKLYTIALLQI